MDSVINSPPAKSIEPEALPQRLSELDERVLVLVLHSDTFADAAWRGGRRFARSIERQTLSQLCTLYDEQFSGDDVVIHSPGSEHFAVAFVEGTRAGLDLRRLGAIERAVRARVDVDLIVGWTWVDRDDDVRAALQTTVHEARRRQQRRELATLLHDVATPLSSIHSSLNAVLDGVVSAGTEQRFLTTARDEAARVGRLIRDFLRIESEGVGVGDLANALRLAVGITEPLARERGAVMRLHAVDVPAVVAIEADAAITMLVVLLENAIKHGRPDGTVQAKLSVNASHCEITIDDDGPGVVESQYERIFEYGVRSGAKAGNGIGLARARKLVESCRGTIGIERSNLGGACFRLSLPLWRDVARG